MKNAGSKIGIVRPTGQAELFVLDDADDAQISSQADIAFPLLQLLTTDPSRGDDVCPELSA